MWWTNAYRPTVSGVVTSIVNFRRGLQCLGHEISVIAPEYERYQDSEAYIFRFPAVDLSERLEIALTWPIKGLMNPTVRGLKPDLIHSQHPILMGDLAAEFAREMDVPLIFTFHSQYTRYVEYYLPVGGRQLGRITGELIGRYLAKCDAIIAPTKSIEAHLQDTFDIQVPIEVLPTPIDLSLYEGLDRGSAKANIGAQEEEILLYVGRLAREKGLYVLLRAFSQISAERPNCRLRLVGRGPDEENLRGLARELGIGEKVRFTGAIPHQEIPMWMAAADLFLFPSTTETQGLVIVEAMAAGTPVLAARAYGSIDMLSEGGGVLTAPEPGALAAAAVELLEDPARRRQLAEEARQASRQYGIQAGARALERIYRRTIQSW
jgi:glycosyltransferase involved in cell wall biosynthesis